MVSDNGTVTRNIVTGTNVRGTPDLSRSAQGRARIIVRTTVGVSSYIAVTNSTLGTPSTLLARTGLSAGPLLLTTAPDVVVVTSGATMLDTSGTTLGPSAPVTIPLRGNSAVVITVASGALSVWCASPTWRSLDVAGFVGLSLAHATVVGSGDAILMTSNGTTWALTR